VRFLLLPFTYCLLLAVTHPPTGGRSQEAATHANLGPGRKYTSVERMRPERLRAVHEDRLRYERTRHPVALRTGYEDYRGILHAHAEDSAHTGGTRPELLAAAKRTGVRIVMLTDHVREGRDFINDSWRGLREGVLFIPGAEAEGFLVYPMRSIKAERWTTRDDYIQLVKRDGGNIFLSHVEEKYDWPTDQLDGLEIYNHHTDVKDETEFTLWLRRSLTDPDRLAALERALAEYPQEVFGAQQDYLAPIIAKWDRDGQAHHLTGVAANDCHHNQGYTITAAGSDAVEIGYIGSGPETRKVTAEQAPRVAEMVKDRKAGELIARLDLDPYERSLSYVTTHILARELTEPAVRQALKQGHAYVAHDWLCDPTGFAFLAEPAARSKQPAVMGDEVRFARGLRLRLAAPAAGIIKLFHNGMMIKTVPGNETEWAVTEPGLYRAEVWLEVDGEQRPWIYANPITVIK